MPSPFPGMDPWLEAASRFPDVHDTLITYLGDALCAALPPPYVARTATRVWVDGDLQRIPDVGVFGPDGDPPATASNGAAALIAGGMVAVRADAAAEVEERYLEVRSADDERLVAAVEILSPSNKDPGDRGRDAYLRKQSELLSAGVSLVEIDLLRGGQHTTAVRRGRVRRTTGEFAYHICTSAAAFGPTRYVAAVRLSDRLPQVFIPLDPGVPPVAVELQPLLDRCYDNRRYSRQIRYDRPPDPPLTPDQQAWADGILREKSLIP